MFISKNITGALMSILNKLSLFESSSMIALVETKCEINSILRTTNRKYLFLHLMEKIVVFSLSLKIIPFYFSGNIIIKFKKDLFFTS